MVGICSSVLSGLLMEELELPVALIGRLYGVLGLDIRMLRFMLRSSSLKRFRAWTSPGTFEDVSVLFKLKLLPSFRASVNGPERWFRISKIRLAVFESAEVSDARLVLEDEKLDRDDDGLI